MGQMLSEPADRREYLGTSEIPYLLLDVPFRTPYMIWREKVHGDVPDTTGPAAQYGNDLEPIVTRWALDKILDEKQRAQPFLEQSQWVEGPILSTPDVLILGRDVYWGDSVLADKAVLEVKTCGFTGGTLDEWGRAGSSKVPERVYIQVQLQMLLTETRHCIVALFSGHDGKGFRMFKVPFKKKDANSFYKAAVTWWERHVINNHPPEATQKDVETMI